MGFILLCTTLCGWSSHHASLVSPRISRFNNLNTWFLTTSCTNSSALKALIKLIQIWIWVIRILLSKCWNSLEDSLLIIFLRLGMSLVLEITRMIWLFGSGLNISTWVCMCILIASSKKLLLTRQNLIMRFLVYLWFTAWELFPFSSCFEFI